MIPLLWHKFFLLLTKLNVNVVFVFVKLKVQCFTVFLYMVVSGCLHACLVDNDQAVNCVCVRARVCVISILCKASFVVTRVYLCSNLFVSKHSIGRFFKTERLTPILYKYGLGPQEFD